MDKKRHVAFWDHFGKVDRGGQSGKSTGLYQDCTSLYGIGEQNCLPRIEININSTYRRYMKMQYRQTSLYPEKWPNNPSSIKLLQSNHTT